MFRTKFGSKAAILKILKTKTFEEEIIYIYFSYMLTFE